MVSDTIQLGAKEPQGKSLSGAKLRGFFYGGGRETLSYCTINNFPLSQSKRAAATGKTQVFRDTSNWLTAGKNPARQAPNFSDNLCRQLDGIVFSRKCQVGRWLTTEAEMAQRKSNSSGRVATAVVAVAVKPKEKFQLPAPFYKDNSFKRYYRLNIGE